MNYQNLLLSSHVDLQRPRNCRSPDAATDMVYIHHTTPTFDEWWNHGNSSFVRSRQISNAPDASCMDSPITSPNIHANFPSLPFSPSYPIVRPEYAPSARNVDNSSWDRGVEPQICEAQRLSTSPGWPLLSIEPFDSNSWDAMILSALSDNTSSPSSSHYTLPSPESLRQLLPRPSPSPSVPSFASHSATSNPGSRRGSVDSSGKICSHCNSTSTPLWRRDPATRRPLCNACGLYLQQRNKQRPTALIAADQGDDDDDAEVDPGAPECSHCHTHRTSVWRRSKSGAKLCNACGVYARLRGRDRPLSLRRNKIRPRCKHAKLPSQ
ncbi:hypothetical protein DFH06DRAFT_1346837 [Mycena polygramma]|nr:hypothetical protein DFH06DRAFT_1346837 [Mycena polygramma]